MCLTGEKKMHIDELIKNCIEHSDYDIPEMTQIILKQSAIALAKLKEYVPITCHTCNHENCEDCDSRLDGWQMGTF